MKERQDYPTRIGKRNSFIFLKLIPSVFVTVLLACSIINFTLLNIIKINPEITIATTSYFSQKTFVIDFFVFAAVFSVCTYLIIWSDNFFINLAAFVFGTGAGALAVYTDSNLFTIKIFLYCAWLIVIMLSLPWVSSVLFSALSIIYFVSLQINPHFINDSESFFEQLRPGFAETVSFASILLLTAASSFLYRYIVERLILSLESEHHINMVMKQLSVINSELQFMAKMRGEEAAKNERLRITRDMHDTCGYTFVNISAIADAAQSERDIERDKLDEIFAKIRNLASNGLQETRKTLHAIRDMENPLENNISTIYDIKNLFISVTGINVEIITGNLKKDYSRAINSIIVHTMQEGLTNAVRHGQASNILVSFWEENNELMMSIKDDGIGSDKIVKGIGLAGMEERLEKVSGRIEISSPIEGGFKITIFIPITDHDIKENSEEQIGQQIENSLS